MERLLAMSGHASTAMMAYGVAALWLHPDSSWGAAAVYTGVFVLMLTPVARVTVAFVQFARAGDRQAALLTLAILLVIVLSGAMAWSS